MAHEKEPPPTPLNVPLRGVTQGQKERRITRLISTMELSGIKVTKEQARKAVDEALSEPLPKF